MNRILKILRNLKNNNHKKRPENLDTSDSEDPPKKPQKSKKIEDPNKKKLKEFEKIKLLGRGSVGHVFLVRLKGTDQLYAMKVLEKDEMIKKKIR